ncbi:N-6 DNA methylase [Roseivirga sp. BDSF3-8]|uniref:N-6 DNA methylase n=1 Tax=Roseivirga sp. BDSF3-8 TaxID=3241598 RepID=UPI003532570D
MLDTSTKKRIDDCRDILVGKLPDPKAQIEQITIGLIYKFMDDMDKEAIDLGGRAKYFSDFTVPDPAFPDDRTKDKTVEFSRYAWDKLFDTRVTAAEMLRLYSDAIEGMEKNPNIPQLFRDIFNNAYLPYRDPETLKLFLKTIGEFEYTHSEKLGDAFEYLLSVMGSQGDAGQFRTPRHIIDFLVAIIDPDKGDTILDPACGTAGFLISAYKHILLKYTKANKEGLSIYEYNKLEKKPFTNLGDRLTPDDRKKLIQNFTGYDISPDMVRLSLVNLYLHGFTTPHINEYDTLSSEERWDENADVVLANPPFMSPKGGIRPHKRFTIDSKRSEVLFVDYIAEHLTPTGKAGIIVPEGVIFQSGKAYKALRKMLVEDYLYAVVSLPAGVFNPYSGVKTSILLMDKVLAKQRNEILFVKIDNDGYNLGAQRTAVKGSQLEEAIALTHEFAASKEIPDSLLAHAVLKTEIAANGDYNLSGERYRVQNIINSNYPFTNLGNICSNYDGKRVPITQSVRQAGDYPYYGASGIVDYVSDYLFDEDLLLVSEDGANLLTRVTPVAFSVSGKVWVNNHAHVLKFESQSTQKYVEYVLNSMSLEPYITGSAQPKLNQKALKSIKIPLPPLSIQEEIVAEIEGYQKIIDGAKAVVAHYKPKIDIDPDWKMVELGEICDKFQYGSSKKSHSIGEVVCLRMGNIQNGEIDWSDLKYAPDDEEFEKYLLKSGDVLFNRTNSPVHVGKTGIYRGEKKAVFAGYLIRLIYKRELILGDYLNYCLNTKEAKDFCQRVKTDGINQSNINAKVLATFQIPLPNIETQHQIVAQIEKEQALVNANKQLIEIFEQKIKDRIAKVWGTSASSE